MMADGNDRKTVITIAIIGAGATIVAAFIGLHGQSGSGNDDSPSAPPSANVATPATSVPSPNTSAVTATDSTPAVRQSGNLTLVAYGTSADLDAIDDPQWGTANNDAQGTWDVTEDLNGGGVQLGTPGTLISSPPSYASCYAATGFASGFLSYTAVRDAKGLCVRTTDGRLSVLKILSISMKKTSFTVTTYAKTGD
jgi:hypothetical protein